MDKVGETSKPGGVTTEEGKFKSDLFCYGLINIDMNNYLKK